MELNSLLKKKRYEKFYVYSVKILAKLEHASGRGCNAIVPLKNKLYIYKHDYAVVEVGMINTNQLYVHQL